MPDHLPPRAAARRLDQLPKKQGAPLVCEHFEHATVDCHQRLARARRRRIRTRLPRRRQPEADWELATLVLPDHHRRRHLSPIDGIDGRDDHAIARLQRSQPRPRCLAAISLLLADCVPHRFEGRDQWLSEGRVAAAARQRWLLERYRCSVVDNCLSSCSALRSPSTSAAGLPPSGARPVCSHSSSRACASSAACRCRLDGSRSAAVPKGRAVRGRAALAGCGCAAKPSKPAQTARRACAGAEAPTVERAPSSTMAAHELDPTGTIGRATSAGEPSSQRRAEATGHLGRRGRQHVQRVAAHRGASRRSLPARFASM